MAQQALVFIPGIMGTELFTADKSEKLWPPTPLETKFGYKRTDQLLAPDVTPGQIIRNVLCIGFYDNLIDQFEELGFIQAVGGEKQLFLFPYDWRQDLFGTADLLAARMQEAEAAGAQEIFLVGHSMGGLISRLLLESGRYADRTWFPKIKEFFALATPHRGAPLALARVLGLDSALGISKEDFKRITSDQRYPSGYQLLPAPGEDCCWNVGQVGVDSVDIYDDRHAQALGLSQPLLNRTQAVHKILQSSRQPEHVRYFCFAGTGHETVTRVNVVQDGDQYPLSQMHVTRTTDAGDGTVPFWSGLLTGTQRQVVVNEHSTVFRGDPFKRVFFRLFGVDIGMPLEAFGEVAEAAAELRFSMPTQIVEAGQTFELLLLSNRSMSTINGSLTLIELDDHGRELPASEEVLSALSYVGPDIGYLRMVMPGIAKAGWFGIRLQCDHGQAEIRFAVLNRA